MKTIAIKQQHMMSLLLALCSLFSVAVTAQQATAHGGKKVQTRFQRQFSTAKKIRYAHSGLPKKRIRESPIRITCLLKTADTPFP